MSSEFIGVLFALGTATMFGAGTTVSRLGLIGTPVVTGTVVSMLAGSCFLAIAAVPRYPSTLGAIEASGWGWLIFTAVINYPMGRLMLFQAMRRVGVARGNTIVSANPAVAATIAVVWLGETLGVGVGVGMFACVAGAVLVAWVAREGPVNATADSHLMQAKTGIMAAIGAMIAYGSVSVLIKKLVTDVAEPITAASLVFMMGTLMVFMLALPRLVQERRQVTFRRSWLLLPGGGSMSLGVLFFYSAASRAPVVAVAPIVSMSPLVAIAFSQVIARRLEIVDRRIWVGAAAVVGGVALISATF